MIPARNMAQLVLLLGGVSGLAAGPTDAGIEKQRLLIGQYCSGCHDQKTKSAGLDLASADLNQVPANAHKWETVIRKLRAGAMPPLGAPRPRRAQLDALASFLENAIDTVSAKPDPGPSVLRRLNRFEYRAAVRDLLDLNVDVGSLLPPDDANQGFDNSAGALRVSPALLEAWLAAARKISRIAVGSPAIIPAFSTWRVRADAGQDTHMEGLPLGTRGGLIIEYDFPLDGTYRFRPRLAVNTSAKVRGLDYEHRVIITIDGARVHEALVGGPADVDAAAISPPDSEAEIHRRLDFSLAVKAGPHNVGFTFVRKTNAQPDGYLQPWLRSNFDTQEQRGVPVAESISIGGPFDIKRPGDTPTRRRIFICRPEANTTEIACAKKILGTLARRAWRRPVDETELETLIRLFQEERSDSQANGFEAGIENGLRFILTSPAFLFRIEQTPPDHAASLVTSLELATRLSFFLWSSLPDDELIRVASEGNLREPRVLAVEVRRMLADHRSEALSTNFAAQWLYLRNLAGITRDLEIFPNFDDNLRQAFRRETELFFDSIVREDRSALDLLRADYTFVNERLAKHYGIPNVTGDWFRRVTIPGEERRGLLGQGSVLTVTSYATRTSPVLRGKWLLENVTGTPVPPPPPGVPAFPENRTGVKPHSVRERMEEHRSNRACSVCHGVMDPLGFALENFDATGAWRTRTEAQTPIDASGILVDGAKVDGPVALRNALLENPQRFISTLTEKLMTYALGRGLEYYDMPSMRAIVRQAAAKDYNISTLILGIVQSPAFEMKRAGATTTASASGLRHKESIR